MVWALVTSDHLLCKMKSEALALHEFWIASAVSGEGRVEARKEKKDCSCHSCGQTKTINNFYTKSNFQVVG